MQKIVNSPCSLATVKRKLFQQCETKLIKCPDGLRIPIIPSSSICDLLSHSFHNHLPASPMNKHCLLYFLCTCVLLCSPIVSLKAQITLYGKVISHGESTPIIGARTFLAGTVIGDITTKNGLFQLKNVYPGTYQIVVSSLGHKLYKQTIIVGSSQKDSLLISLEPEPIKTNEVQVTASRLPDFRLKVQEFIRLMLGTSPNGQQAKLLNPEVLDVRIATNEDGSKYYEVSAREPLLIFNKRLGYNITFIIEKAGLAGEKAWFQGPVYFEELQPKDSAEYQQWKLNRLTAYLGSLSHFLHTLIHAPMLTPHDYQGFQARRINSEKIYNNRMSDGSALMLDSIPIVKDSIGTGYSILFPACFDVIYKRALPESSYRNFFRNTAFDDSNIENGSWYYRSLIVPQKIVVHANERGFLYSPDELLLYGYWGWQRLADEVPLPFPVR
jgi:hypothetical protein